MNEEKHKIGNLIAKLRKDKGWTQKELADKLNVSDKAISKWETNSGEPDKEFFPLLAEVFGISIDYLMTGKEQKAEIITMNKFEHCCAIDDVKIFNTIDGELLDRPDENGKYFVEYLKKYDCPNVYNEYIKKVTASDGNMHHWLDYYGEDETVGLMLKYSDIEMLEKIKFFESPFERNHFGYIEGNKYSNLTIFNPRITEKAFSLIGEDSAIMEKCLKIHENYKINSPVDWQQVYTTFLTLALKEEKHNFFDKLLNLIIKINEERIVELNRCIEKEDERYREYKFSIKEVTSTSQTYEKSVYYYSVIPIPVSIIEHFLNSQNIEMAQKLNEMNRMIDAPRISQDKFEIEKLKQKGNVSERDIFILNCMHSGIVSIDELITCNDISIVEYAFDNYSISLDEHLNKMVINKDYKQLFRYSVDHDTDLHEIAYSVMKFDEKDEKQLLSTIEKTVQEIYKKGYFDFNRNYFIKPKSSKERYSTEEVKSKILNEMSLKMKKERFVKELNKEYFEFLLSERITKLLAVELCKLLETIFKYDYNYEGTFEEMMVEFERKDSSKSNLLHKLRKFRNSVCHPVDEKVEEPTIQEFESLINYIC
ncbi:MAG: helix-turn-helix transcriptional regulator [Bacilli bacterium]|nr:helix-turn-helix transcriptional regulator [Bacilli bacterium]